jgi:PAS domain S-box-containing protein
VQQGVASALSGAPAVLEYRVIRPDGTHLWLRDELRRTAPEPRGETHLVGAAVDVTARRQDEESLQALNLELLRRTDRQRAMLDLSAEMARASTRDQLLSTVCGQLRPVLGAALVTIAERVVGGGMQLTQLVRDEGLASDDLLAPMGLDQLMPLAIGAALSSASPISTRTAGVDAYPDWVRLRDDFGYRQFVVVPLIDAEGPFGTLNVAFGEHAPLTDDDVEWVAQFGSTLAAHIVSHRAVDALERLNNDLEARVADRTRELTESESRFHLLFQYAPQAMLMIDGAGRVTQSNQAAHVLFGADEQGLHGRAVASLLPDDKPADGAGAGRGIRVDGSSFFAEVGKVPLSLRGVPHALAGIADITERVTAQGELVRSLRDKETLLQEIHHRVKNNLQIISSLLQLQSDEMPSEEARKVILESVFRVRSMALIHQQLYGVESLAHIDFGEYARTLGMSLGATLAPNARLVVEATPVELTVDVAVPLGLILNELLTNAFKYGLPYGPRTADWDVRIAIGSEEERVRIEVCDRGPGLPGSFDPERSQSLGLHLVRSLSRQLRGHLTWTTNRGGACLSFTCPRVLT